MKRFFTLLSLFIVVKATSQTGDTTFMAAHYSKKEEMIKMRDGVKLYTAIYIPKDKSEKHPILMMRTPYSAGAYGANKFSPSVYSTHWFNYVKENYIIVLQDVRGKYMSEGEFEDVRPFIENKKKKSQIDEASDTYDAIDWLVKNVPDNNGKVGVFGISYPGFYSTMAALSGHPALKAVSPQAPVTDWFIGDDFHHNGAFALADGFSFYSGFGKPRPRPTTQSAEGYQFPEKDNYNFYLKRGALKNFAKYLDSVRFWNDLMTHPNYDEWWKSRDARRACKNVAPAMLVVGGTFDAEDCFGAWNLYKAIEKQSPQTNNKLVMGPWFHGGWSRGDGANLGNVRFGSKTAKYYQENLEIPFFNYYLKGKGSADNIAEATVFFSGENSWKKFESWPPKNITNKTLYFKEKGRLGFEEPNETNSASVYTSDPLRPVPYTGDVHLHRTREYMSDDQRFAARRPDVLVFETSALDKDLRLAGPVIANLMVNLSSTDADFVVKLIDVFPDNFSYDTSICCKGMKREVEMAGYQMLVRGEIMRGRYRNSFEKPEAFWPGKTETVKFELPDVAHTFKQGHKLMIQVQSSWFPLFDRNPQKFVDIYSCDDTDFVPCEIKVLHQKKAASSIILPVLEN
ncbi:MAG: CocE/NonD family hydrolase [Bacteroidia bacterium]|nr:CocE/NonD family hydrolase [Bacteroidia bacterium]